MEFQPMNGELGEGLLKNGQYKARVTEAEETSRAKSGAPMMKLTLLVQEGGFDFYLYDYLTTDVPSFAFKLRHFCESAGLAEQYAAGQITCQQVTGKVVPIKVGTQDATADFPAKNVVDDYVTAKRAQPAAGRTAAPTQLPPEDADCPF